MIKKLSSNKGSTLTVTLVIIVVLSILAATAAMTIALSTRLQLNNEKALKEKIELENCMYELLSLEYSGLNKPNDVYYLYNGNLIDIEDNELYDSIVRITNNGDLITIAITLDYDNALTFELNSANEITKWGMGKWNQ